MGLKSKPRGFKNHKVKPLCLLDIASERFRHQTGMHHRQTDLTIMHNGTSTNFTRDVIQFLACHYPGRYSVKKKLTFLWSWILFFIVPAVLKWWTPLRNLISLENINIQNEIWRWIEVAKIKKTLHILNRKWDVSACQELLPSTAVSYALKSAEIILSKFCNNLKTIRHCHKW